MLQPLISNTMSQSDHHDEEAPLSPKGLKGEPNEMEASRDPYEEDNHIWNARFDGSNSVVGIATAIAAIVIAALYDKETSPCGNESYVIELQLFLHVAGYLTLSVDFLFINHWCCGLPSLRAKTMHKFMITLCYTCLLFLLVWDAIGFYMYANQMSEDCQQTDIAIMILALGIIQYSQCMCRGCCAACCCYLYCKLNPTSR
eukprot:948184_1